LAHYFALGDSMRNISLMLILALTTIISACGNKSAPSVTTPGVAIEPVIISPLKEDMETKINNFLKESTLTSDYSVKVSQFLDKQELEDFIQRENGSLNSRLAVNLSSQRRNQTIAGWNSSSGRVECLIQMNRLTTVVATNASKTKIFEKDLTAAVNIDKKEKCKELVWGNLPKRVSIGWTIAYTEFGPHMWSGSFYSGRFQGKEIFIKYIAQNEQNKEIIEIFSPEKPLLQNPVVMIVRERDVGEQKAVYIETITPYTDTVVSTNEYEGIKVEDNTTR
jgi:hypothetical protein